MLAVIVAAALLVYGVVGKAGDTTVDDAVRGGSLLVLPGAARASPRLRGGGAAQIDELRGSVVVVNLWASWCGPCEAEPPVLQRANEGLRADGDRSVLGITTRDIPRRSQSFERTHGITSSSLRDLDNKLYRELGSTGVPETFVPNRRGRVVAMRRGQVDRSFLSQPIARARASR